jgi:hypothetical protein
MDLQEKIEAAGDELPVKLNRSEHRKEHIRQIEGALVSMHSAPKKPNVQVKGRVKGDRKITG